MAPIFSIIVSFSGSTSTPVADGHDRLLATERPAHAHEATHSLTEHARDLCRSS
jgi:hypothetical protein